MSEASLQLADVLAGVRVLVVEDDPDMRMLTNLVLSRASAKVTMVRTAAEALARLQDGDPPQVLVSDINLPGEDGISLIRNVRALPATRGGSTPALAVSGHTDGSMQRLALAAGYQSYLTKPASPRQLLGAIAALALP
jgi:two-component system CheB/CheR fusion protein